MYIYIYISKDHFTQRPLSFKTTGETRAVSDPVLKLCLMKTWFQLQDSFSWCVTLKIRVACFCFLMSM